MGCRLPGGSTNPTDFWNFLNSGGDAVDLIPGDRWDVERHTLPGVLGKSSTSRGGFLDDVKGFDAGYFGISPREAQVMDPQQRILLEVTAQALADAGITAEKVRGKKVGVFIGASAREYERLSDTDTIDTHSSTGVAASILANRISYLYDLRGPSLVVDTACSSGLHAVHLGLQSLWNEECDIALVGAVNLLLHMGTFASFSALSMLSEDGVCRAFDANGKGFVRGEGAGIIVLKPMSRARRDADRVYATVLGSGINQDGMSQGMTVPSQSSQEALLREVYAMAGVNPASVQYVEAHGTGTPVGDPIEARALGEVLGRGREKGKELLLGSVKTNIGHLEAAAGVAGMMKAALALYHGRVPQNLHFVDPNPHIPFDELSLKVLTEATEFDRHEPIFAGVNSFGFGGANAHVVLSQTPPAPPVYLKRNEFYPLALPLSAQSEAAYAAQVQNFLTLLEQGKFDPAVVSYNCCCHREHYSHRALVFGRTTRELIAAVEAEVQRLGSGERVVPVTSGAKRKVAFVFTGQGPQWWGMARELLTYSTFRSVVDRVDRIVRSLTDWSLLEEMRADESQSRMNRTDISQPAVFAVQVGLVEVLREWGLEPQAVVGHSMGEVAAACTAGILTLEEATRLIVYRGQAMEASRPGKMMAVGMVEDELRSLLRDHHVTAEVAAVNSPYMCTVAGDESGITALEALVRERGIFHRTLPLNYAFHSELMNPVEEQFRSSLGGVQVTLARLEFASSVTGGLVSGLELDLDYQWNNIRRPVLFYQAVKALIDGGCDTFIELGPDSALVRSVRDTLDAAGRQAVVVGTLKRGESDSDSLISSVAHLYRAGLPVNWRVLFPVPGPRVDLPDYPWQRKKYWSQSVSEKELSFAHYVHPVLGWRRQSYRFSWESELAVERLPYLEGHRLDGGVIFPGSGLVEAAFAAVREVASAQVGDCVVQADNVKFASMLLLEPGRLKRVFCDFDPLSSRFGMWSKEEDNWVNYVSAQLRRFETKVPRRRVDIGTILEAFSQEFSSEWFYSTLTTGRLSYTGAFQGVEKVWLQPGSDRVLTKLSPHPSIVEELEKYQVHPAYLDAMFQGLAPLLASQVGEQSRNAVPVEIESITCFSPIRSEVFCLITPRTHEEGLPCFDIEVYSESGEVVARIDGLALQALDSRLASNDLLYRFTWQTTGNLDVSSMAAGSRWASVGNLNGLAGELAGWLKESRAVFVASHSIDRVCTPEELRSLDHLVYFVEGFRPDGTVALEVYLADVVDGFRNWSQALLSSGTQRTRLWVVTQGFRSGSGVGGSSLWGMTRVLASEVPYLRATLLDVSEPDSLAEQYSLRREFATDSREQEVAFQGEDRFVHRLMAWSEEELSKSLPAVDKPEAYRLCRRSGGELGSLYLQECSVATAEGSEVTVKVAACSLNFSDVLKALDLYPGTPGGALPMGLEFSGTIINCGPRVERFQPGDRVMGMASGGGGFATHLTVDERLLISVPSHIELESAAGIPVAFLTAYYAMVYKAGLSEGDSILVHSASGGVGLAALSIAKHLKLKVFATAGSQEKHEYLRVQGVEHVFNSRSLDFASEVLRVTGGLGVDAVLNSLTGEALKKGLECLAPGGRFLEIGKRDIYEDFLLPLRRFRNNLSFHAIDLEQITREQPETIRRLLDEIAGLLETRQLAALPVTKYDFGQAEKAFRTMSAAKHVGRIVLAPAPNDLPVESDHDRPLDLTSDHAYLVTGGLGGFGGTLCRWLYEHGARKFILLGRRDPVAVKQNAPLIEWLRERGAEVAYFVCNVAKSAAVEEIVDEIGPLSGVFHCATVYDDCPLEALTKERLWSVLEPKLLGAWNLHRLTCNQTSLRYFVLFSSVSALYGGPGQANYNAANVFLDHLAHHRRSLGLPALSVNWGAIRDVGYLAERAELRTHLEKAGVRPIDSERALKYLDRVLKTVEPQVAIAEVDWRNLGGSSRLSRTTLEELTSREEMSGGSDLRERLLALNPAERVTELAEILRKRLSQILGLPESEIEISSALADFGLDSLMAFELRNWIQNHFRTIVPASVVLRLPSLHGLAEHIALKMTDDDGIDSTSESTVSLAESKEALSDPLPEARPATSAVNGTKALHTNGIVHTKTPKPTFDIANWIREIPSFQLYQMLSDASATLGLESPFFQLHDAVACDTSVLSGREMINFTSYNYLGLCGHPEVNEAAAQAISRYGTSVSGSRLVGGERPIHRELERALCDFLGTEEALLLVSGHATNVSVISHLVGSGDLILHDALAHDSAVQGAAASGASVEQFPHNDLDALELLLERSERQSGRVLVYAEGLYSMDGDLCNLPRLLELKERFQFLLLIDEAHSIGVLGDTGAGIAEHFHIPRQGQGVLWMGTLSKALASCGGFLTGDRALIEFLRHTLPGFVYSVGLPPTTAAASLKALEILRREPDRLARLRDNSSYFYKELKSRGCNLGTATEMPIIPVVEGSEERCLRVCAILRRNDINVSPILFPAVPPGASRLRFFLTSEHTPVQLSYTADCLLKAYEELSSYRSLSTL